MFQSKTGEIVLKIEIHCFRNAMTLALQWSPDDHSSSAFSLETLMTTARTITYGPVMGESDGARIGVKTEIYHPSRSYKEGSLVCLSASFSSSNNPISTTLRAITPYPINRTLQHEGLCHSLYHDGCRTCVRCPSGCSPYRHPGSCSWRSD